jgi:membrane-bound lytic murein transglycosylase A
MKFLILSILFFSFKSFSLEMTPTEEFPLCMDLSDDLDFENLDLAISRQKKAFRSLKENEEIKFGEKIFKKRIVRESLELFEKISKETKSCLGFKSRRECFNEFNLKIQESFDFYRPVPEKGKVTDGLKRTKFTSYYSPDFNGSRFPSPEYPRAIYKYPENSEDRKFSRVQIDYEGALAGKNLELFWVKESFFDLYLLHVQGGGRVNLVNQNGEKEIKYLSYVGSNSQKFQMIFRYMLNQGYITNASIENQRTFLNENPDKQAEVFGECPSYVFFKESNEEPVGVQNIPLTEGRSLAIDTRIYKTVGLINFVKANKVVDVSPSGRVVKTPFSRFFISQDTGGAIRGNARCDLYFGYGRLAELMAYNTNELGEQYFLIKKD